MKLIDTDIAIDHFHGHQEAFIFFMETLSSGESIAFSVVSLIEILAGLRSGEEKRSHLIYSVAMTNKPAYAQQPGSEVFAAARV
ncbi:MAG: hypothetical protein IBX69_16220 [Anaerolineales bacterium]|nr:hypothetical protein [Anaerolineales bacterium]